MVLNNIFEATHPDTLFVSSGGSRQLPGRAEIAVKILEKAFDDVDIFVLTDRDEFSDGEREVLLRDDNSRRMLGRREIENYLFDPAILEKAYGITSEQYAGIAKGVNPLTGDVKSQTGALMRIAKLPRGVTGNEFKVNLANFIKPDTGVYEDLAGCIFPLGP